jgi:hypothetical protein
VIGDICKDYRIGADHGAAPDSHSRADDHVLTQPGAVADLDGPHTCDALLQHGSGRIVEGVHVIGDVNVTGEQDLLSQPHGPDAGKDATAGDTRSVPDRQDDVLDRLIEDLEPGPRADEHIPPDDDATLTRKADWQLEDRSRPKIGEGAADEDAEQLVASPDENTVGRKSRRSARAL